MKSLVVVPTYNELHTIERVVNLALDACPELHLLIVDDASPDGTGTVADRMSAADHRVHTLHRHSKDGLGAAYRAGFSWGVRHGYDALCEMDADLSHDPRDLPRLLAALQDADVAIGSRYVPGGRVVQWPARRLLLSRMGNAYVRALTGLPVSDATAGFRAFRVAALQAVDFASVGSDGYAFQIEVALRAWRVGLRIAELPIVFTERSEGVSKMDRAIVAEALWRTAQWGVQGRRGSTDRPAPSPTAVVER